jgi:hypothetical protein
MAWKTVGPQRLTDSYRKYGYSKLRIYPSHYFIPQHFTGLTYEGSDPIYAHQLWGSTRRGYDELHKLELPNAAVAGAERADDVPAAEPQPVVVEEKAEPETLHRFRSSKRVTTPILCSACRSAASWSESGASTCCACFARASACSMSVVPIGRSPIRGRSLHLALEPVCAMLDGVDPHTEALEQLKPFTKSRLFSSIDEVTDSYDLVLVPEVMEHVPDVAGFLAQLEGVDAPTFLLSVPDAFQCRGRHFDYVENSQTFVEVVHPDHNAWYTPYTFANTIRKYSSFNIEQMWFFNRISLLALLSKDQMRLAA